MSSYAPSHPENRRPMTPKTALLLALLLTTPALHAAAASQTVAQRPAAWATPLTLPGVHNLYKITDNLYRSQQPDSLAALSQLGIKTVINLRMFHDDADLAPPPGLHLIRVPVNTWQIEDADVIRVLKILRHRENGPFLLHCQHGADRTGVMSAMYRLVEQGWTKEQALRELQDGGYGFHTIWFNITRYIEHVDVARIRAAVDAPETPARPAPVFPES